jgi:hypothetical protein
MYEVRGTVIFCVIKKGFILHNITRICGRFTAENYIG